MFDFKKSIGKKLINSIYNVPELKLENEPDYCTIAEQNLEYYREAADFKHQIAELKKENMKLKNDLKQVSNDDSDKYIKVKKSDYMQLKKGYHKQLKNVIRLQDDKESSEYNENLILDALDKTTHERNVYKDTINEMCDKYNIPHHEVFEIVDCIEQQSTEKVQVSNNNLERER